MNCPHHHRILAAEPRSYRDLPLRLAEYGTCYRYEQSGELFGLMRVRFMQMNDAHIYCTAEQFAAEFNWVEQAPHLLISATGRNLPSSIFSTLPVSLTKVWAGRPNAQASRLCYPQHARQGRAGQEIRPASRSGGFRLRTSFARSLRTSASTTSRCRTRRRTAARCLTRKVSRASGRHRLAFRRAASLCEFGRTGPPLGHESVLLPYPVMPFSLSVCSRTCISFRFHKGRDRRERQVAGNLGPLTAVR